jgi:hypothetical protein
MARSRTRCGVLALSVAALAFESEARADDGAGSDWRTVGYVSSALGVIGLGAGAGFVAQLSSDRCDNPCTSQQAQSWASRVQAEHVAAITSFSLGGALLASGVLMVLLTPPSSSRRADVSEVYVAPMIASGAAGIAAQARW